MRNTQDSRLAMAAHGYRAIVARTHLRTRLDADDFRQLAAVLGAGQNGAVIRDGGRIAFKTAAPPRNVEAAAFHTEDAPATVEVNGQGIRLWALPVTFHGARLGVAVVWRSIDFVVDYERSMLLALGAAAIALAIFGLLVGSRIASHGLEPLEDVAAQISEIEGTDLGRRIECRNTADELRALCLTFNRLLDRLEAAFARQRQFTADASHDLRAPLAVMRAESDLALERPRSEREYRDALVAIQQEIAELDLLLDALLTTARAESSAMEKARVQLHPAIADVVSALRPFADKSGIRMDANLDGDICVTGERSAVQRMLTAVVHNALQFATGRVTVNVAPQDTNALITVRDDGPGFSRDGLEHATERFWRDDRARGRHASGLGLAVARAVAESSGGSVTLGNVPEGGAVVSIMLPLAPSTAETLRE